MDTRQKDVTRYQGRRCAHVSLLVDGTRIRSIRPLEPHLDPVTGRVIRGDCAVPGCGRLSVAGDGP